jgi:hypothetical protein
MALNNYSNLKATIIRLDGSNSIADIVDDAIDLAEAEMYANATETIKHRSMEIRSTSSLSTRFLALPTDFLEMRSLHIVQSSSNFDVRYATPESINVTSSSGKPQYFTVTSQIEFDRVPDSSYTIEMSYLAKLTALDDTNTTNDILTDNPSVYLYGALWAVNLFNAEEEKAQYYYGLFTNAVRGANKRFKKGRYGPAPTMKYEGSTP